MVSQQNFSINPVPLSSHSSHRHVQITGLRDTVDHSRSEPDPHQKAFSEQIVRIQTYFFPVDDEKTAWLRLVGSNGRHTVQLNSKRAFFARQTLRSEFLSWREQASWRNLKKAFDHIQHSFATTALQQKGESEQFLSLLNKWWTQSDVAVSMAGISSDTRISFQRGLAQGAQSRLQSLWLFLITSWGTWMQGGETETSGGKWTTSTLRALLTLTTPACWRQAKKNLSLW